MTSYTLVLRVLVCDTSSIIEMYIRAHKCDLWWVFVYAYTYLFLFPLLILIVFLSQNTLFITIVEEAEKNQSSSQTNN